MTVIERAALPGIGVRFSLTTADGRRLAVVCHHSGRRDLMMYPTPEAETASGSVSLTSHQAHDVAELLYTYAAVDHLAHGRTGAATVAGLPVTAASPYAGARLRELRARLPGAVTVVAVLRGPAVVAGPDEEAVLEVNDVVVATGSPHDVEAAAGELAFGEPSRR